MLLIDDGVRQKKESSLTLWSKQKEENRTRSKYFMGEIKLEMPVQVNMLGRQLAPRSGGGRGGQGPGLEI